MALNIELYEALKGRVGEKAARMVAEALPRGDALVTQSVLRQELGELRHEMRSLRLEMLAEMRGSGPTPAGGCSRSSSPCGSASTARS